MIFGRQAESSMKVSRALTVLELMLCLLLVTFSAHAQTLAGRWAASGKTLENGEQPKAVLDVNQVGDKLCGTLQTLGFLARVTVVIVPEYTSLAANFLRFKGSSDRSSFVHRGSHNEFCG